MKNGCYSRLLKPTTAIVFLTVFAGTQLAAEAAFKHHFYVESSLWSDSGDANAHYGIVPFVGNPLPNEFVGHSIDFNGKSDHSAFLGYACQWNKHWAIQVGFSKADVKFEGDQSVFESSFMYQFYEYWSGTWGEPMPVTQVYNNPRTPTVSYDQWTTSLGIMYLQQIKSLCIEFGLTVDYSLIEQGKFSDWFFASSQIGSRSILFNSAGFLSGDLDDSQRVGGTFSMRVSYPIWTHLSVYAFARIQHFEGNESQLQLNAAEPLTEGGIDAWYIYNDEDLHNRVNLESVSYGGFLSSAGVGLEFEF